MPDMLPLDTLAAFSMASILLGLAPGPDNLFVLSQATLRGSRAGLIIVLGLCTGLLVHTCAVALGLAVVFKTSALAFSVLKIAGAGYLAWLAWQAWRAGASTLQAQAPAVPMHRLYLRGIIMNVTNPKVSIFFLAFLPQFADPARGPLAPQLLLLGGVFILCSLLVFSLIALLAGSLGHVLARSPRIQIVLNRLTGLLFLGLAIRLATATRSTA